MSDKLTFKDKLIECGIKTESLLGATFLITGATGLIGKMLATELVSLSERERLGVKTVLFVRNKSKLGDFLSERVASGAVDVIEGDVANFDGALPRCDYVVHCASVTESKRMVETPVEVIKTNVYGTINMLEYARLNNIKAFIYLSSMEAYGFTTDDEILTEDKVRYLNPLELRSSYPESKRMAENLCVSYSSEYGVPVKIIRLAQTFGRGVAANDRRAFAEFARCALEKRDIVLLTDGASARMYLDTEDAIIAILAVLLKGEIGKAYNAANKNTYCSIAQMAALVAEKIGNKEMSVKVKIPDGGAAQFPPAHKLRLDTSQIELLGWRPYFDLSDMYDRMISDWNK